MLKKVHMIEFSGEVSKKLKKKIKKEHYIGKIRFGLILIIMCIVLTVFTVDYDVKFAIGFILPFIIGVLSFIPPSEKTLNNYTPTKIVIDSYSVEIFGVEDYLHPQRGTGEIKSIIDYGDYYEMNFKNLSSFVCQKDLITKGTIEEFEEMFSYYILRAIKEDTAAEN